MINTMLPAVLAVSIVLGSTLVGCEETDSQLAREAADRQAEQNRVMAELHEKVASATEELVAADSQARREILGATRDLQGERSRLDQLWSEFHEVERSESLLVALLPTLGVVTALCLLLGFCWQALFRAYSEDVADSDLNDLLVEEITSREPRLLQPGAVLPSLKDSASDDQLQSESD